MVLQSHNLPPLLKENVGLYANAYLKGDIIMLHITSEKGQKLGSFVSKKAAIDFLTTRGFESQTFVSESKEVFMNTAVTNNPEEYELAYVKYTGINKLMLSFGPRVW